jgi:hypothetical protein
MFADGSLYLPTSPVSSLDSSDAHNVPSDAHNILSDQISDSAADDEWIYTETNAFAASITGNSTDHFKTINNHFRVSKRPDETAVMTADETLPPRKETKRKPYHRKMRSATPLDEVSQVIIRQI